MKKLLPSLIFVALTVAPAYAVIRSIGNGPVVESTNQVLYITNGQTSTGVGQVVAISPEMRTFDVIVAGTGAVTATVVIEVSNNGTTFFEAGTVTLSGTTVDADGFAINAKWAYTRTNVTAITGTGAAVTVTLGV